MFDSLQIEDVLSELYDLGVRDESLSLLFEANKEIEFSARTLGGLTSVPLITSTVLWGGHLESCPCHCGDREDREGDRKQGAWLFV